MTIQPYVCFNLVVHKPSFQKNIGLPAKYPCKPMKIGKEYQKKGNFLFFGDKFNVIPKLKSKYMPCLPNATLSNNGNVPGITL